MPTLEQVCKRLFAERAWFVRCVVGALLLAVPVAHFFAFGYLYEMVARARRGDSLDFPEWDDWRRMFVNGIPAFIIFLVLGVAPIFVGWLLSFLLRGMNWGVFVYLPVAPFLVLAAPLTAAGIYQFQKREEYRDAFRIWLLIKMLRSAKARFYLPTFAMIGFITAAYPLMSFTIFIALAVGWSFFSAFFRAVEDSRKSGLRPSS
jgi:MFS family permease